MDAHLTHDLESPTRWEAPRGHSKYWRTSSAATPKEIIRRLRLAAFAVSARISAHAFEQRYDSGMAAAAAAYWGFRTGGTRAPALIGDG